MRWKANNINGWISLNIGWILMFRWCIPGLISGIWGVFMLLCKHLSNMKMIIYLFIDSFL